MLSFTYLTSCSFYFCQESSVWIICGEVWFVGVDLFVLNWNPKFVLSQSVEFFSSYEYNHGSRDLIPERLGQKTQYLTSLESKKYWIYSNGVPWSTLLLSVQKNHKQTKLLEWGGPGLVSVLMQEVIIVLVSHKMEDGGKWKCQF